MAGLTDWHLFMLLLGCKPVGRNTEQHDIYFGIAEDLPGLLDDIFAFWPEAREKIHIDAWRKVTRVGNYEVRVEWRKDDAPMASEKLFFLNLGGYKPGLFEEFHYKLLTVAGDKGQAIREAMQTAFYQHTGFEGANSHIDDKYGIDVDDIYEIGDILSPSMKKRFAIHLLPSASAGLEDEIHLGYLKASALQKARAGQDEC